MNKEAGIFYLKEARPQANDPKDIKLAKLSRKLDVIQVAGGAAAVGIGLVAAPFLVPIGAGFVAFNGVEYVATGRYIKWREENMKKKAAEAAAKKQPLNFPILREQYQLQKAA